MLTLCTRIAPIFVVFLALFMVEGGMLVDDADARSRGGGRSFRSAPQKAPAQKNVAPAQKQKGGSSFGRGLAGGLLGGAIGSMLFGSMFGGGGQGMGILPLLLLGGVGYFLYRKFSSSRRSGYSGSGGSPGFPGQGGGFSQGMTGNGATNMPPPPPGSPGAIEEGMNEIRQTDSDFDASYFQEIASDVFFQVQAGWMRRDLDSYRHLLGAELAAEYEVQFTEMRQKGVINKLESIAIRKVDIIAAGNTGTEDFVTVLFTANLLDYTVNDKNGELVEGSMTEPVKFEEEWTWSRPTGTNDWKLEGIKVVGE